MKTATLRQAGKIVSLFEDTPGDQIQALLESGLLADLRDANIEGVNRDLFRKHLGLMPVVPTFEIYRTLTIGGVPADELLRRLEAKKCFVSDWARDVMGKPAFTTAKEKITLNLARATVRELGFMKEPTTIELFRRVKELGELCPGEVGPHLRLVLDDQRNGDYFWVAMEPIVDSHGNPHAFGVERRGGSKQWLYAFYASPERGWSLEGEVVFVLRKAR
ncbi:MAG: hypothetical protein HYT34_00250 [Candidatus Ryanbacteria bacterium]|nr:hypothetical protein [Candidatus Ryanbacteria bacterium]